jgi:signal transduction histidine kinase
MAQLLGDGQLSATQAEQLAIILSCGESLLKIIDDILDFSKIKAGRVELESIGFSLHDLLSETLQLLAPQALGPVDLVAAPHCTSYGALGCGRGDWG